MKLVGNKATWSRLVKPPLAQAALLVGPDGVGRRSGASMIAQQVSRGNHLVLNSLLAPDAEKLVRWVLRDTGRRVAVVSPGKSSTAGWNRLLKLLESLPERAHVWIVDEGNIPVAIKGRCHHFVFEPLETSQVLHILRSIDRLDDAAKELLDGEELRSVSQALDLIESKGRASNVVAWLGSVERGSREELLGSVTGWTRYCTTLLMEDLSGQYGGEASLGVPLTRAKKETLLNALSVLSMADPPSVAALTAGLYVIDQT